MTALLGIGASLLGGLFSSRSAKKAAAAQERAAQMQVDYSRETRDLIRGDMAPYRSAGENALSAYLYNLGMGPAPTIGGTAPAITTIPGATSGGGAPSFQDWASTNRGGIMNEDTRRAYNSAYPGGATGTTSPERYSVGGQVFDTREQAEAFASANPTGGTTYGGFQQSPGYQFAFDQGTAAVNALAGARGGLDSGATRQALTEFGQGIANQEFGNYMNRLFGTAGMGQAAAGMSGDAALQTAGMVNNAYANMGNAQSAGHTAQGNIWSNTFNDIASLWQYQNANGGGWGFGGSR